jgi:hypothetical protein
MDQTHPYAQSALRTEMVEHDIGCMCFGSSDQLYHFDVMMI